MPSLGEGAPARDHRSKGKTLHHCWRQAISPTLLPCFRDHQFWSAHQSSRQTSEDGGNPLSPQCCMAVGAAEETQQIESHRYGLGAKRGRYVATSQLGSHGNGTKLRRI